MKCRDRMGMCECTNSDDMHDVLGEDHVCRCGATWHWTPSDPRQVTVMPDTGVHAS